MKYTNLEYDPQHGWKVGSIPLVTERPDWVLPKNVEDVMAWISPKSDTPSAVQADGLVADAMDTVTQILYDDNGQLIALIPADRYNNTERERIVIDSAERLATAMNLHVMDRRRDLMLSKALLEGFMKAIRKTHPSDSLDSTPDE